MKVVVIGWGNHIHVARWSKNLTYLKHEVTLISVDNKGESTPEIKQRSLGPISRWSFRLSRLYLKLLLWIEKPDVIHVQWASFAGYISDIWKGPLVVTLFGSDVFVLPKQSCIKRRKLNKVLLRADGLIASSQSLADEAQKYVPERNLDIRVIPRGIDTQVFTPKLEPTIFEQRLQINRHNTILSPRSWVDIYNVDKIIEAFGIIEKGSKVPNLLLSCLASSLEYKIRLNKGIDKLVHKEKVSLIGKIPYTQMPDFYRSAFAFISIPDSDGTANSVLEAMACGVIPIVSDIDSMREWITDGWNGFLVIPRDINSLVSALRKVSNLSDKERLRMAQRCRSVVVNGGDWRQCMKRTDQLYQQILS